MSTPDRHAQNVWAVLHDACAASTPNSGLQHNQMAYQTKVNAEAESTVVAALLTMHAALHC
jgi:hypothetical protein